jgi:hypothetical protein
VIGRQRKPLVAALAAIIVVAVPAFASAAGGRPTGATAPPPQWACTERGTRTIVFAFVRALKRGDFARLDMLFAPKYAFKWYSTTGPGARLAGREGNRATLIPYFRIRHQKHERLTIRSFKFNGNGGGYGHFEFFLTRKADDLAPTRYAGKGAIDCLGKPRAIAVWSMSPDS